MKAITQLSRLRERDGKEDLEVGASINSYQLDWRRPELDSLLYINARPLCPSKEDTLSVKDSTCRDAHIHTGIKTKRVQAVNIKSASIFFTASSNMAHHVLTRWGKYYTALYGWCIAFVLNSKYALSDSY